jgi:hypothetical protein
MLLLAFFRAARGARDELREDRDHLLALVVRESSPRSPNRVRVSEPEAPEVLRAELQQVSIVLGMLTKAATESSYVLMELGAA